MARAGDTYPEGFEWDGMKLRLNVAKHGIDFVEVVVMFAGFLVEERDDRLDYGEERWLAYGEVEGRVIAVVYTWRGGRRRLISARRARAMSERSTMGVSLAGAGRMTGATDWKRVDKLTDEEIEAAIAEDPDTFVPNEAWWRRAVVVPPGIKKRRASLELDEDVLGWFRKRGRGHQHAINHALRRYMEAVERGRQVSDEKESAAE